MDRSEKKNSKRQSGKKLPRVPIKTYKWEDVRRSRRKGGYPWTYLYKEAFNESVHPERFRMDGLRKNKTSSASSVSDSIEIREITEDDIKGLEGIDSSYVVIESPILLGVQMDEPMKDQEGIIESADSSDNISQYLDKEERGPERQLESTETLTLPGPSIPEASNGRQTERAKSEEPKRKRKLSIDSNYSRISLSKLGVMKRLKEAKEKIKLPKFSSKSKKETEIENKKERKQVEETKKEPQAKSSKNEKPVYIHIPLKPPEGEKDEFSHLEFEEKRQHAPQPVPEVQIEVTEEDTIEEDIKNIDEESEENTEVAELNENNLAPTENNDKSLSLMPPNDQEDDVSAIIFLEGEEGSDNKGEYDIIAVDIDENSQEMKMSQITNTEVRRQVLESIKKVDSQPNISGNKEGSGVSLSRSSSKASKTSKTSIRKRRAKSVEPEKKRRGSIDSSYSRKSLSKIGLLKKLKQFHMPFGKSQSKKSITDTSSTKAQPETLKETNKSQVPSKDQKPVYIHIPLKPPEGQQDEFSHLEFETAPPPRPTNETNDTIETSVESPIDTPQTAKSPQFIVLTPPSDDELLDKPDIPDTPSSETGSLFQFGELKQLAKKAVDQILESVDEEAEQKTEKSIITTEAVVEMKHIGEKEDIQHEDEKETITNEKVTIDEEDGLKSIPEASDEVKSNLKSNLKGEGSPLPKKKVSFKRRKSSQISQVSKDDGYEEIESPSAASVNGETSTGISDADVSGTDFIDSASADEAEPDLDTEKLVKSTSLEEDRNRWSKISDHEYEPINPPPEEKTGTAPPKSHVSEVLNPPSVQTHQYSDDELDLSVQEMQSDIENRFFGTSRNINLPADTRASPSRRSPSKRSSRSRSKEKEPAKPGKLQTAIRESATKFKTRLQGIKKPTISLPSRPKFQKPNFKKPNINLPKLPDLSSTFRRSSKPEEGKTAETKATELKTMETKAIEEKSSEAKTRENSGSKGIFDFSTYPRIFKKKKREHDSASLKGDEMEKAEKKTWKVRSSGAPDIIRIPLHSEASMDQDNGVYPQPEEILEVGQFITEDVSSPSGYQEDIETDDEDVLQRERQEKHRAAQAAASETEDSRWDHGNFYRSQNGNEDQNDNVKEIDDEEEEELHEVEEFQQEEEKDEDYIPETYQKEETEQEMVTDLDQPEETQAPFVPMRQKGRLQQNDSFDTNHSKIGSSVSSLGQHRRGVLEEIDSDQFFLREKGISQDNIDVGKYLSTEIREAFRSPANALADIHSYNYEELRASNQSLPETKRKPVKKPKRRKTPHASQERLRYEPESENEDYNFMPPIRPKRKSKRKKRPEPETIPYVETFPLEPPESMEYSPDHEDDITRHYENDRMEGIEQPHIQISEPYGHNRLHVGDHHDVHRRASEPIPAAPPRKHKSLKSLNASEHESIFEEYERNNENANQVNGYANEDVFISSEMGQPQSSNHSQMQQDPPRAPKPPTRSRSKTRSISRTTSQADRDSILGRMDSIMFDEEFREPVVEEPCVKDLRDAMGYAIVDKNQNKNWEHRCCTVPRSQGRSQPPERPLRNYSTLGPSRPERKLSRNMTDEEKENIEVDMSQYIEIEDERDLHSGEVIQKIQNRPLPAPPRPPRSRSKPLNEITSRSNVEIDTAGDIIEHKNHIDETEVSTQTEPLPSDFVCEEMIQEETDKIMTPSALRKKGPQIGPDVEQHQRNVEVERILITPTQYSYQEETITHGQLLVEPLNGARILPDSEMSRERIIPVTSDEEEMSEVPENFRKLSDPKIQPIPKSAAEEISDIPEDFHELSNPEAEITSVPKDTELWCETGNYMKTNSESMKEINPDGTSGSINLISEEKQAMFDQKEPQRPPRTSSLKTENIDLLKTQKLQVSDLDVDRLTVNELVANKIVVSEIESGNISSHEINSKSGTLKLADLELQPEIVRKLLEQLQESSRQQHSILGEDKDGVSTDDILAEEKKTLTDSRVLETSVSQYSNITLVPLAEEDCSSSPTQNSRVLETSASQDSTITLVPLAEEDCSSSPAQNSRILETSVSQDSNITLVPLAEEDCSSSPVQNSRVLETSASQDSTITIVPLAEEDYSSSAAHNSMISDNSTVNNEKESSENVEEPILFDDICKEHSQQNIEKFELLSSESDTELKNEEKLTEEIVSDIQNGMLVDTKITREQTSFLTELNLLGPSTEENISIPIVSAENISNSASTTEIEAKLEDEDVVNSLIEKTSHVDSTLESKEDEPPVRPPRTIEKKQSICEPKPIEEQQQHLESTAGVQTQEVDDTPENPPPLQLYEPDVDDEPPPRPPQPQVPYIPSQPPASFYALRAQHYVEDLPDDIPLVPRRKRQHRPNTTISKSSSSESTSVPVPRRRVRSPEPSIPQLTGQLVGACSIVARNRLKRLIDEINSKISTDPDADTNKQNVQVIMVILLVLIIGLLLLGYGDGRTVHLHHWEYFNPPTDI